VTSETLRHLTPEFVLIAVAMLIYTAGLFCDLRRGWKWIGAGGLATAAVALVWSQQTAPPEGGAIAADPLACYIRWLALGMGILLVMSICRPAAKGTSWHIGSLLLAVAGLMLTASAADLVLLFASLELISIPIYVLLWLGREGPDSAEATAKYFFPGILASAMLLYGFAFLYGMTGSTNLGAAAEALANPAGVSGNFGAFARLALVLVFAGLGFKIAAVPFHFYAPDVFQRTTHGNAALLSTVPKAAGFVAMVRLLGPAMANAEPGAWRIILLTVVLTMTLGNVLALWQDNLRRLLAYASIAQTGYILMGLAAATAMAETTPGGGIGAMWFYLCTYAIATIGTFAALEYLGRVERSLDNIDELAGLARTRPAIAAVIAVLMLSLTGIPPLAGFWAKLFVFRSTLDVGMPGLRPWFVALAIIAALNAVVAAVYYLRIVRVMYFRVPLGTPKAEGGRGPWLVAVLSAAMVILIGILPGPLRNESNKALPGGAIEHSEAAGYSLGKLQSRDQWSRHGRGRVDDFTR